MKRILSAAAALALICCLSAASAGYHKNSQGIYVDDNGQVVEDFWDDDAGIYIVNGVGYDITNEDENGGSSSGSPSVSTSGSSAASTSGSSDGGMTVTSTDGLGLEKNPDGSITVESGQIQVEDSSEGSTHHLTQEEWAARWAKYSAANGTTTGTVYMDEQGEIFPAEIEHLGLGRSTIIVEGKELTVPTSSLKWDTEAPDDHVLAVVTPAKQSYLTLRAKKSQKSFVMGHCEKCTVLRVISTGKTWTMVDDKGIRGYVMTSGLTFYSNAPKQYAAAIITVKGKTPSGNTVHVRSAATNNARQIAEYPVGTTLTVFSQDDKWSEVDVAGLHCYILNQFVTLQEPLVLSTGETEETTADAASDTGA